MEQLSFFDEAGQTAGLPKELLDYHAGLFGPDESITLMRKLIDESSWVQKIVRMYDKEIITPRLTAWYGDPETFDYNASDRTPPAPWTKDLLMIKARAEAVAEVKFNSVLLNYYRDGNDSVAWHSDNETVLDSHPVIASVSFGQVRTFDIRNKKDHRQKHSVRLENGSLLLMKGDLQLNWDHRIAKSVKDMNERLNLTFRIVS
jgi:alkylated DNA repair dioxygenase AlkB